MAPSGFEISSEVGYFKDGLEVLAPGAEVPCLWHNSQRVVEIVRNMGLTNGIVVTASYESLDGKQYEDTWRLNPEPLAKRRLLAPEKNFLETIATHLDNLVYIQTLENLRPWWRRVLNVRAYESQSLSAQVARFRRQKYLGKISNIVAQLPFTKRNGDRS